MNIISLDNNIFVDSCGVHDMLTYHVIDNKLPVNSMIGKPRLSFDKQTVGFPSIQGSIIG